MSNPICKFYSKIGACRHGERCSRTHIKPISSETLLLVNLYQNPKLVGLKNATKDGVLDPEDTPSQVAPIPEKQVQELFDRFYEDVFIQLARLGEIDSLVVCENENDHLNGNVYAKFVSKDIAYTACQTLNTCWYGGKPVYCELSPVDSFHDAICRSHETNTCTRGDHCNFMHTRRPSPSLKARLFRSQEKSVLTRKLAELVDETKEMTPNEPEQLKVQELAPASASQVEALFGVGS